MPGTTRFLAELEVFQALQPVLARDLPCIITELLPVRDPASKQGAFRQKRQDALLAIIRELGYKIIRLHVDGSREPLEDIVPHSEIPWCNYLFAPADKASLFA